MSETPNRSQAVTIDEYIAEFPEEVQVHLRAIRALIAEVAPDATELISYAIPTFDLNGRHLIHFAAFAKHIGLYPGDSGIRAFETEIAEYKHARGSVQFPLDKPIPTDLIRRITEFRLAEEESRGA